MRLVRPQFWSTLPKGYLRTGLVVRGVALMLMVAMGSCGSRPAPPSARKGGALEELRQGGFVVVELRSAHHWASLHRPERGELELGAMFVHHWGGEPEDVARQLGVRGEEELRLAPGACVRGADLAVQPLGDFDEDAPELSVELMDAGALLFALEGRSDLLGGEPYPEVLPNISGHHYHRILPLGTKSVSTRRVSVLGLGGRDVSAFELAEIHGPAELRVRGVGGWSPAEGSGVVSARDPLVLRWTPGQPRFDTLVWLRWSVRGSSPAGELVCRPVRPGRLTILRSWLSRIPMAGVSREVTLTVETAARTAIVGPLPGGVRVRVSQSDSVTLQVVR
jgi:hypothetical protein